MTEGAARAVDVAALRSGRQRLGDIHEHRSLLVNLIRRDLRVRYKGSVLGFLWSLLNPAMYLVVFSLVFTIFLPTRVPLFGVFMLSGLLVWNFFTGSLQAAAGSILDNRALVQKVWFPREVLPLASVGAGLVNMALQAVVLVVGMLIFQNAPDPAGFPLLLLAVVATTVVAAALGIMMAALTVGYRDVGHLLEVALTAWFWLSAVVFPFSTVSEKLGDQEWLAFLNPVLAPILTFQRVLYNPPPPDADTPTVLPTLDYSWFATRLGVSLAMGLALLWLAARVFAHQEQFFGDQL